VLSAPVLLTVTLPPPLSLTPVTVSVVAVFTRLTSPLVAFVALKLVTVFALFSVVPVAELVVSNAPLINPAPASLTSPAVPVRLTLPAVLTLPALSVTSRPAVAVIAPVPLETVAFTRTSLVAPVAVRPTVPAPPAVTSAPIVSVPLVAVRLMLPPEPVVTAPLVVRLPVFATVTFAPGVCVIPLTVKVVAVFVRLTAPLVLLLALNVPTAFAPLSV
jgi:hypothetical protein